MIVGAAYLGWKLHQNFHRAMFDELMKRLNIRPAQIERAMQDIVNEEKLPENMIEIKVEQDVDMLRAYEVGTDAFIGQAKTAAALRDLIQANCRGKRFCITDENGAHLIDVQR